ncbi:MAG: hypothetical protein QOG78_4395 [Rhodospirillaceae bacterium]|jgi:hypothetical protein|nr:hypothetical protein [Rhodospirillaceae bacterium]
MLTMYHEMIRTAKYEAFEVCYGAALEEELPSCPVV